MWFQNGSKKSAGAETAVTGAEGSDDRYAVNGNVSVTEESAPDTSVVSSDNSSYVSTGTSFESDDSAIDPDDLFDEDELDELMDLETNPIMGGWVDSACGWLDKPMCFMPFGKETSLLRQSKGRAKSTLQQMRMNEALSTVANMKLSAAERRNLRLSRKGLSVIEEGEDILSTNSSTRIVSPQRIQPKEETEKKVKKIKKKNDIDGKKPPSSKSVASVKTEASKKVDRSKENLEVTTVSPDEKPAESVHKPKKTKKDRSPRVEDIVSRDPEGSHHSRMVDFDETSHVELAKSEEELDDGELSQIIENALMDSPDPVKSVHQPDGEGMNIPELELPESDSIQSGSQKGREDISTGKKENVEDVKNDSTRSERSGLRPVRKNRIMKVMERSKSAPRRREITDLTDVDASQVSADEPKTERDSAPVPVPKPIEIIDVLSMDDNDSWTPGNASIDPEPSVSKRQFEYHGMPIYRARSKSRDPSPSLSRRSSSRHQRDPSPSQSRRKTGRNSLNADDLWNEEEAKLSKKKIPKEVSKHRMTSLSSSQTVDDIWTEEEQKLQENESIFDDPQAREAFLGHRRGRLQNAGSRQRSSSQSRRRLLVQALHGGEEEEGGDHSKRSTRSKSVDARRAPAPEAERHLSRSRSSRIVPADQQDEILEGKLARNRSNKNKDLVAVRTIEDGQKLRSHRNSNSEEPIDVHEYMERSSSRERIDRRSPLRRSLSRRRKSKTRELVDLAHVDNYERRRSVSRSRDARDDQESRPDSRSKRGSSKTPKSATGDWPDYETVASATKELRKLEKKIEKQLRQVQRDSKSKDDWESQTVSSKEIKKLEKQLAQKLKRDNEKRATKLKRIKRKVPKAPTSSTAHDEPMQSNSSNTQFKGGAIDDDPTLTGPSKSFSQKVDDFRERSKFDQLRSLRSSRYMRSTSSRREGRMDAENPEDMN